MTDQPATAQGAAPPPPAAEPPAAPVLVHSGVYTLWETPGGGRLLAYKRLTTVTPGGQVVDVPEPKDERLPHIPPEALPLVSQFLDNGIPPAILQVMGTAGGKGGRLGALRQLAGLLGEMAGAGADAEQPPGQPPAAGEVSRAAGDDFGITED
jgi:hypothetical protein